MRKVILLSMAFCLSFVSVYSQADCSSAVVICGNTQTFNPNGIGLKLEQLACGGIEHNSYWVAFQAKASGKLNFVIRPLTPAGLPLLTDVDWSLWQLAGPPGVANCNNKTQLSCNFSGSATVFGIPGATGMATPPYAAAQFNPGIDVTAGTWYTLMLDQFSNTTPIIFQVQFTGNPESPALNSTPAIFDNRPDFDVTSADCNGAYTFTNNSAAVSGIGSVLWNFGDGSTSTVSSPSHTYATPGTYYTTLTVTDGNGCKSDIRKQVVYNNAPPVAAAAGILVLPSCSDANNGSIIINSVGSTTPGVSGGTVPYTYELVSPSPMIRPAQASNTFTGLQPGGYTVKVNDACGKSGTVTVTVAQVAGATSIGLGIQNIQSACTGTPTGSATIFANGTVPPYTMQLVTSSPVTTGVIPAVIRDPVTATYYVTFNNLLPGAYTVEATDACGKVRRATFTVTASTAPVANTVASSSCGNSPTGTLTVTATAATGLSGAGSPGVYQYSLITPSPVIRPFQNSSVFENLWPGAYTVAVKDACGNIGTATVNVTSAVAPTFGTAFSSASCPNGSTGSIEFQLATTGGGSPYTFELIAPSPVTRAAQTDNEFDNLPPGTYIGRVTDACGNQVTQSVTVNAAAAPSFTGTVTASCTSPASGTITVVPGASSIGPYTFELISPGAAIRPLQGSNIANSTNSIFTGLDQGSYTVRMTDGCTVPVTGTVAVTAPAALVFPAGSVTVPSCSAASTGAITVAQPTTGLATYRYELIAPSSVIRAPQYSRVFNNLPVGSYTVRITDSCGTQVTVGAPLTVTAATAPALTAAVTSSCASNTGTITASAATANQGGGTYLYSLIAPSPVIRANQASPIFTGLPAGAYTVQITDQCGATGTVAATITTAGAFAPAAGGSIVKCSGTGYIGQIIVTNPQNFTPGGPIPAGSGGGPYTYALYNFDNTVLISGPQVSNIFPSVVPATGTPTHTVRVTDICGNTSTAAVTINAPLAVTAGTISAVSASCAASATGVIRITTGATNGLTPYTYSLIDAVTSAAVAGPQSGLVFSNVPANGINGYLLRTVDACGNAVNSSPALLFPAAVAPTGTAVTTASCAPGATGTIVITPGTGATLAGGTFSYALYDAGNTVLIAGPQASPAFANVAAGNYTVRITDRCGTTGVFAATVSSTVTALTAAGTPSGTCPGGNSGVITASFTGGSLPVTYTLVNQPTGTVITGPQAGNIFTGLAAGTYIVRTIDACGTVANSTNITIADLTTSPTITTSVSVDCSGSATFSGFGAGGSGGPYTYAICSGAGCAAFGAYSANSKFTVTSSGTYRINVRDRCGNSVSSADVPVTIPTKSVITSVSKLSTCGNTAISVSFTNTPNTPYYSVDGANFSPVLPASVAPGCHTVRVADFNAGVYGCASDVSQFSVFGLPTLTAPNAGNINCANGQVTVPASAGDLGCAGSGAAIAVKLISCAGCSANADPVGTVKAAPFTFKLGGASSAGFVPAVTVGGSEICAGATPLNVNFVAACGAVLQVKVEYFRGSRQAGAHLLDWKVTPVQTANGTIELQNSTDALNFKGIYSEYSTAVRMQQPYAYTNKMPYEGINYYRLKLTDDNGNITYSNIVPLSNDSKEFDLISIMPNPVTEGSFKLNIGSSKAAKADIIITDPAGRILVKQASSLVAGINTISMNVEKLASGIYNIYAAGAEGKTKLLRFVKQ